jgi:hypothetical protein
MATYRDPVKTFMVVSSQLNPTKVNFVVYFFSFLILRYKGFLVGSPSTNMVVMNPRSLDITNSLKKNPKNVLVI